MGLADILSIHAVLVGLELLRSQGGKFVVPKAVKDAMLKDEAPMTPFLHWLAAVSNALLLWKV